MSLVNYLDLFLDPVTDAFSPEVAKAVVAIRADDQTQTRIEELRHKANEGTLTPDEESDYKEFVEAVDVVSIIQSKARKYLAKHSA